MKSLWSYHGELLWRVIMLLWRYYALLWSHYGVIMMLLCAIRRYYEGIVELVCVIMELL